MRTLPRTRRVGQQLLQMRVILVVGIHIASKFTQGDVQHGASWVRAFDDLYGHEPLSRTHFAAEAFHVAAVVHIRCEQSAAPCDGPLRPPVCVWIDAQCGRAVQDLCLSSFQLRRLE